MASRTRREIFPRPMASWTLHVELHPPARLRDLPCPVALRTLSRRLKRPLPMASRTSVMPRNIQPHHPAANCRPERHIDLIFQIRTRLRPFVDLNSAPAAENSGKNVAEAAAPAATACLPPAVRAVDQVGEIKSAEIKRHA